MDFDLDSGNWGAVILIWAFMCLVIWKMMVTSNSISALNSFWFKLLLTGLSFGLCFVIVAIMKE